MPNLILEYIERVKAPTPSFFKKMVKLGTSITLLFTTLSNIPSIPTKISDFCSHFIWVGATIVAVSIAAKENVLPDAEQVNNNQNNQA